MSPMASIIFYHAHIISRLAIRHQLLVHGSALTPGEIQVIESKQGRLQRLINAFEHQADLFLLWKSSLNNIAIHPVHNYTQYAQPDQPGASIGMESEHPTTPTAHFIPESDSDGSGMSPTNPADLLCYDPSAGPLCM